MNSTLNNYKKISSTNVANRTSYDLSTDENTKVNTILTNFFTYFKAKHS